MTTHETRHHLLTRLSDHFDLPIRQITFIPRGRSRAYCSGPRAGLLLISDASPLGEAVCLHEFAHWLAEHRAPRNGHYHGTLFRRALLDCMVALTFPFTDYPWDCEYVGIQRWARTHGYWRPESC